MTREAEIEKAIYYYSKKFEEKMNGFDYFNHEHIEHAFIDGIEWADNNPKSPWISVKDDLPCNHKELISGEDKRNTIHVFALVRGLIILSRMEKFEGEWHWITDDPTYWMIIPKLPK